MSRNIRLKLGNGKYLVAGELGDPNIKEIYVALEDDQGRTIKDLVIVSQGYDWGNMKPIHNEVDVRMASDPYSYDMTETIKLMIVEDPEDQFGELAWETEYRFDSKDEWKEWNSVVQNVTERHQTEKDFDEAYSYALEVEKEGSAGTYFDMNFHSVAVLWAYISAETMQEVFGRYGQSELHLSPSGRGFSVTYY